MTRTAIKNLFQTEAFQNILKSNLYTRMHEIRAAFPDIKPERSISFEKPTEHSKVFLNGKTDSELY